MAREDDEADALLAAVGFSADDWLAAASATARSQRQWLRQQATESATMAGVLLALAERDEPVSVRTRGWSQRGRLRSVTSALCILDLANPPGLAVLRAEAVIAVEGPAGVTDDRAPSAGPDLASVLELLVASRPAVTLLLAVGTHMGGTLIGLGKDVVTIRLTSSFASVRLSGIDGVILLARGSETRTPCD